MLKILFMAPRIKMFVKTYLTLEQKTAGVEQNKTKEGICIKQQVPTMNHDEE